MIFVTLLRKDLLIELRGREVFAVTVGLSLMLAVVAAFGIGTAFLNPPQLSAVFPAIAWLIFIFAATVGLGRSLEAETQDAAIEGLLVAGVSPPQIYSAKVFSNSLVLCLGQLIGMCLLALLLAINLSDAWSALFLISALVVFGYSALATLLTALCATSSLRGVLLPLILLPVIAPLFFSAIELTHEALENGRLALDSPWLSLLVGLDVVYFLLGLNLYGAAIKE